MLLAVSLESGIIFSVLLDFLADDILGLFLLLLLNTLDGLGRNFLGREDLGEQVVGLDQVRLDLLIIISGPELEGSGTLEEFADTLRLLDTREFDEDTAAVAQFLDGRLGHAETVDTVTQDVEGVGDGTFGLTADDGDDLVIGAGRVDAVAEFVGAEDGSQALAAGSLLPSVGEEGDEVLTGIDATLARKVDSLGESGSLVVAGQGLDQVLELDLQHDVHTALEVEAEIDLLRFDIFVLISEIDFLGRDGVEVAGVAGLRNGVEDIRLIFCGYIAECGAFLESCDGSIGIFGGFLLLQIRHECEGELPQTRQAQKDGHKSDCTFTLHVLLILNICISVHMPPSEPTMIPHHGKIGCKFSVFF